MSPSRVPDRPPETHLSSREVDVGPHRAVIQRLRLAVVVTQRRLGRVRGQALTQRPQLLQLTGKADGISDVRTTWMGSSVNVKRLPYLTQLSPMPHFLVPLSSSPVSHHLPVPPCPAHLLDSDVDGLVHQDPGDRLKAGWPRKGALVGEIELCLGKQPTQSDV